jgi:DNA mismatch repair protein MutS
MKTKIISDETKQLFNTWKAIKQKYSDAVVVIRHEETYTTFNSDAITFNQVASIRLATNKEERRQCSFPFYHLDSMLSKLIKAGHRVAVCDQLESSKR